MTKVIAHWTPKYKRVRDLLEKRLRGGDYPPGFRLPNQDQLAEEYGVSLLTMRQAIKLLESDGLVQGLHGVGTFVAEPMPLITPPKTGDCPPGQVALILAETPPLDGYVADTIHALDRQLRHQGRHLLVTSLWNRDVVLGHLPPSLQQQGLLGGIIEHRVQDLQIEFLQHHGVPIVVLGSYSLKTPVSQVVYNQEEAMRLLCHALLSGRKGDAHFLFHQTEYHYLDELVSGYMRAVSEAGRAERLHVLPMDHDDFNVERRVRSIVEFEGGRRPFSLLVHSTPAGANRIAHVIERLYREKRLDTANCPVVFYGDAILTQTEMRLRFNPCGLDVDLGVGAALSALNRVLAGEAPARTVIEPSLDVAYMDGQHALRLSWRLPDGYGIVGKEDDAGRSAEPFVTRTTTLSRRAAGAEAG